MIEEPGSFSGMESSQIPQRGPEASQRDIVRGFRQRSGKGLQSAARLRFPEQLAFYAL
jgi:hypothetical protein